MRCAGACYNHVANMKCSRDEQPIAKEKCEINVNTGIKREREKKEHAQTRINLCCLAGLSSYC